MAHGGHAKRREAARRGTKGLALQQSDKSQKIKKKSKAASIKNQMRSIQRLLKKNIPAEMKDAQEKRLEDLKRQAEQSQRIELERKMSLRYRRVKFFERRKIERAIKQIEKSQKDGFDVSKNADVTQKLDTSKQLERLKEDLEYVRFFPKTEKYVSLFMGHDDEEVSAKRSELRKKIKVNLAAAAAQGVQPEEMENDEDQVTGMSDDDFFLAGSSSDDADVDDKWPHVDRAALSANRHPFNLKENHQQHQRPQNPPSSRAQFENGRPWSTGKVFKNKVPLFHDENQEFKVKKNKNKSLKVHHGSFVPKNFPSIHACGLKQKTTLDTSTYTASQPANDTFKTASYTSSLLKNSSACPRHSHPSFKTNPDFAANKPLSFLEADSSIVDAKKKRRRKHRPKKKKA